MQIVAGTTLTALLLASSLLGFLRLSPAGVICLALCSTTITLLLTPPSERRWAAGADRPDLVKAFWAVLARTMIYLLVMYCLGRLAALPF